MGLLVDGKWKDQWYDTKSEGGAFKRQESKFRNWITNDGSAGPTGEAGFKAEKDRYHLYVSHACPWAHRAMIFRALKGLEEFFPVSVVHWYMAENGWEFKEAAGTIPDPIHNANFMHQIYTAAQPDITGRVTVPVIWDKHTNTIVNNESSEIIRMLNSAFDDIGAKEGDYYPKELRQEIDAINERVYNDVNNGVYKSGFATSKEAYEEAVSKLFESLDWLEDILSKKRYLTGDRITEADWRLFTTIIRFDPVYVGHFKCNIRRIEDYPNLHSFMLELYQMDGIAETVHMDHIKKHYYESHDTINPTRIVPVGPQIDYSRPHGRG